MRNISTLAATLLAVTGIAPGAALAQATDPDADSPSGVIYEIPLESARDDAAPRGGGSGGTQAGNGEGGTPASPPVPSAPSPASVLPPALPSPLPWVPLASAEAPGTSLEEPKPFSEWIDDSGS